MPKCSKCGNEIEYRYINGICRPIHINSGCIGDKKSSFGQQEIKKEQNTFSNNVVTSPRPEAKTYPQKCFWCDDMVYHFTHGYGDYVLFDSLGWPWQIHECWEKYYQGKGKRNFLEIEMLEAKSQLIKGAINQLHCEKEEITEFNIATKLGITVDQLKKSYKDVLKYEIATRQFQCSLCHSNVCFHTSNGEFVIFNHLGEPWEIHECWFRLGEELEQLELFDLSILDFKSRIIKGVINNLYRNNEIPTEKNVAEILNISIKEFRLVYKGVCRLSGNRIILKKDINILEH